MVCLKNVIFTVYKGFDILNDTVPLRPSVPCLPLFAVGKHGMARRSLQRSYIPEGHKKCVAFFRAKYRVAANVVGLNGTVPT